jgi:hypothetical protein
MPFKVSYIDVDDPTNIIIDFVVDGFFFFDMIITFLSAYEEIDGSIKYKLPDIAA